MIDPSKYPASLLTKYIHTHKYHLARQTNVSIREVSYFSMEKEKNKKKQKKSATDLHFRPSTDVKGIKFGAQFIVKSFTIRRASPLDLLSLLNIKIPILFPSTIAFLPTNFTILAHHAWHTLTLGLGTKKSKIVIFVFESESMKLAVDRIWPQIITLGEVNKKLIKGLANCEMARFKFRKGCITFYVYVVRAVNANGFLRADDLRSVLESVVALNDFLDHTAMLAIPSQRGIGFSNSVAMAC